MKALTTRIDRVCDYLEAERARRAAAEEMALRQLTAAELEQLNMFVRANTSHGYPIELGRAAQMNRPGWLHPDAWEAALRYEELYFFWYRRRGGNDEPL